MSDCPVTISDYIYIYNYIRILCGNQTWLAGKSVIYIVDKFPTKTSIYSGLSIAMFDY